jgi:hypothetical protein
MYFFIILAAFWVVPTSTEERHKLAKKRGQQAPPLSGVGAMLTGFIDTLT